MSWANWKWAVLATDHPYTKDIYVAYFASIGGANKVVNHIAHGDEQWEFLIVRVSHPMTDAKKFLGVVWSDWAQIA